MSQAKNVNTTNRRAVLAGIAALPIAALPAIAAAATLSTLPSDVEPDGIDWAAVLGRAEHVVESLRTRHVCVGWQLDEVAAGRALEYIRSRAAGSMDESGEPQIIEFFGEHGQSLDWVIDGDPTGLVCRGAARSNRAALADAVLLDLVERYHVADAEYVRAFDVVARMEDKMYAIKPPKPPRGLQTAKHERDKANTRARKLEDQIIATPATTMHGVIAKARCVALNLTDGQSASMDPDADFAASMTRDLLAMKAVS